MMAESTSSITDRAKKSERTYTESLGVSRTFLKPPSNEEDNKSHPPESSSRADVDQELERTISEDLREHLDFIEGEDELPPSHTDEFPDMFYHPGLSSRPLPPSLIGGNVSYLTSTRPGVTMYETPTLPWMNVARNTSSSTNASYETAPMPRNMSTNSNASYRTAPILNGLSNASIRSHGTFASAIEERQQGRVPFVKQPSISARGHPALSREENPSFIVSEESKPSQNVPKSEWLSWLQNKGVILGELEALDWSGRGQHVEYGADEESMVPLKVERALGHSATALVEAVRCRRIRLARKRIRCNRRLTPYDAIVEVEHLQRLQHYHVVRVVGTYIIKKDLSILLYPVTEWNLEEFMDDTVDRLSDKKDFSNSYEHRSRILALRTFFGCMANALHYIHSMNIKHMDIKPKNFLVKSSRTPLADRVDNYKIYIADFGIARSYNNPQEAETDSWTSFTRTYAAPEVIMQERRGFSADVFSFGCVMVEMLATIISTASSNLRTELQDVHVNVHGETSFQANIPAVKKWLLRLDKEDFLNDPRYAHARKTNLRLLEKIPYCLDSIPALRPSAEDMALCTESLRCLSCENGPEPFEAAEPLR